MSIEGIGRLRPQPPKTVESPLAAKIRTAIALNQWETYQELLEQLSPHELDAIADGAELMEPPSHGGVSWGAE